MFRQVKELFNYRACCSTISLFGCWVFSVVFISVTHKDALQLVEALCVNGAD